MLPKTLRDAKKRLWRIHSRVYINRENGRDADDFVETRIDGINAERVPTGMYVLGFERAKSSLSVCKQCGDKIKKGELRFSFLDAFMYHYKKSYLCIECFDELNEISKIMRKFKSI